MTTRCRSGWRYCHPQSTGTWRTADGRVMTVRVAAAGSAAANPVFDVTPARLVSGLITERGRCEASEAGLVGLFPERGRP